MATTSRHNLDDPSVKLVILRAVIHQEVLQMKPFRDTPIHPGANESPATRDLHPCNLSNSEHRMSKWRESYGIVKMVLASGTEQVNNGQDIIVLFVWRCKDIPRGG